MDLPEGRGMCDGVYVFLGLLSARLVLSLRAGKALIDGIFSLPMVLPPTVVGFFLLIIFGKNSLLGGLLLKWESVCCSPGRGR